MQNSETVKFSSFNALSRKPMIFGVPYMVAISLVGGGLVVSTFLMQIFSPPVALFSLLIIPVLLFIKVISVTDDRAFEILLLEAKWTLIKAFSSNAKHYGGTLTIVPMVYGRKQKDVKQLLKKSII